MSHAKFTAVGAAVEKDIINGIYTDRLPTVKTLAEKYGVAIQTMHNALKPLVARGVIRATRHGSFVNRSVKPFRHKVGVFGDFTQLVPTQEPRMKFLSLAAAADGDELVFLGPLRETLAQNPEFYKKPELDGYIFLYSDFDLALSAELRRRKIPALICNHLPESLGLDSIDYNHQQWLDEAVGALVACGCRRIGTLFSRSLNNLISWEAEMSTAAELKREYQLKPYRLIDSLPAKNDEQLKKIFDLLISETVFPDALIMAGHIMHKLVLKLIDAGKVPGRDYLLVIRDDQSTLLPEGNIFACVKYDEEKNARAIWNRFRELRNDPVQPPKALLSDMSKSFIKLKKTCSKNITRFDRKENKK